MKRQTVAILLKRQERMERKQPTRSVGIPKNSKKKPAQIIVSTIEPARAEGW